MATVVGVLDQDSWSARTDNIVVADPASKSLTWIPRDLWCPALRDRINEAFAFAGFAGLLYSLRELGIQCDYGLVLRRSATEHAAAKISVEVPVDEPLNFLYPLAPTKAIEEGHKLISFRPPAERLEGERIHQWIGARMAQEGKRSDLDRIQRQQIFLRALLEQSFDFASLVADPNLMRVSDEAALKELASVDASWRMQAIADLRYERIFGKSILVKRNESLGPFDAELPQLAAVVLAVGAPPATEEAVRSLIAQELRVEMVVVNSGGGGMAQLFARRGIDVTVIEREEMLNLGTAKNLGIKITRAPLVSFLEAECIVRADWSRRRVFFHKAGAAAIGSTLENAYPDSPFAWAAHFVNWPRQVVAPLRGGISYERRLFEAYGFFREDLPVGEEREFHDRLPPDLRPNRKIKIRAIRTNPTRLSRLLSDEFRRGAREARARHEAGSEPACRFNIWRLPIGRALRAYRKAKKNRAFILLALPIIPIAVSVYCLGNRCGLLGRKA